VATSALEMQQNASRDRWTFEHSEGRLEAIMRDIHTRCHETAVEYGRPGDLVLGANVAGFLQVAEAVHAHGLV
jgi:glutamate dehydrogenase (NADP+)